MQQRDGQLLIWDSSSPLPVESGGRVLLWQSRSTEPHLESILDIVDERIESVRGKYVEFIGGLAKATIGSQDLRTRLEIRKGIDLWSMGLLVEKSLWKSPEIVEALKLIAFDEFIDTLDPISVRVVSSNPALLTALGSLCDWRDIDCTRERSRGSLARTVSTLRGIRRSFPLSQGRAMVLLLKTYLQTRRLRGLRIASSGISSRILLCTYFIHLDKSAAQEDRHIPGIWGRLTDYLRQEGLPPIWLNMYLPHSLTPTAEAASDLANRFNSRSAEGRHSFLRAYLTIPLVLAALFRWFLLSVRSIGLGSVKRHFVVPRSGVDLWPILKPQFLNQTRGWVALENILWVAVFDAALDQVDTLKVGLFPFENQGWEKALSWAWYRHGHGHLIGVAHSTVRPWDLRYHGDCRAELGEASTSFPETLVFNGRAARSTATLKPSQTTSIAIAEALRFEHLLEAGSARLPSSTDSSIVVLGNHDAESTAHIFSLLAKASERTGPLSVLYRPHPSCTYKPANTSDLSIHWSQAESIGSTLKGCELAICGSHTSASVDALFSGVAVVVVKAQNSLNLSPLLGRSDVDFVSNPDQLSRILITPRQRLTRPPDTDQFFCLDPNMPRWKKLLGDSLAPPKHRDP